MDKSEVVRAGVESKLSEKIGRGLIRDKIAASVSKAAANKISDETVAVKMSEQIVQLMPTKMNEMGLIASAQKVYGKGPFFVIKL